MKVINKDIFMTEKADDLDILSSIWIISCNDENSIMTYEGLKCRLGLPDDHDIKKLIKNRLDMFRHGVPNKNRLERFKQALRERKYPPQWLKDLDNESRNKKIDTLTVDDVFRNQFRAEEGAEQSPIEIIDWGLQHIDRLRKDRSDARAGVFWKNPLFVVFITALFTMIGATLNSSHTAKLTENSQIKINNEQKRQQVFGELTGRRFMTVALHSFQIQASIHAEYLAVRWKLGGSKENSVDFQEHKHWTRKHEDLVIDIAKNNQSLFETIGLVRALFPNTSELKNLTNSTLSD
jgi:hypothetical protein